MSQLLKASGAVAKRLGKAAKTSLAVVGLGTVGSLGYYYYDTKKFLQKEQEDALKKRVLVLPFHRFKMIQKEERDGLEALIGSSGSNKSTRPEEVDVHDLVEVIHKATSDPSIVAIYGEFGHGSSFSGGAADAEQIRNALRIFRESHRVHPEPNCQHDKVLQRTNGSHSEPRPLYAYADTFESMMASSNPDYYLASIFTHVHLQKQGTINLAGFSSSVPFFRDTLQKYGIKAHVYKHGPFKNAPNGLTETSLTREHRQNIETYLLGMNVGRCHDIASARRKTLQAMAMKGDDEQSNNSNNKNPDLSMMWKLVQNGGSFTALNALQMGFVDYTCDKSPLDALLEYNKKDDEDDKGKSDNNNKGDDKTTTPSAQKDDNQQKRIKKTWGNQTDLEGFTASEQVTYADYRKVLAKRKRLEKQQERLAKATEKYPALGKALAAVGYGKKEETEKEGESSPDKDGKKTKATEKIALVSVNGVIDPQKYRKLKPILRKIKYDKDIKAVVVKVDSPGGTIDASEAVYQDLKDLPQNVVFSFGNVAASGGYYIATAGDRIFASKNTITGSIGVFAIRLDLTGLAAQYGVKFGHVSASEMALANSAFHPVTKPMHLNYERLAERSYDRFKQVVSTGRLSLDDDDYLESIAQGRVFTGEQANKNGLVDEIGGLSRAIDFAQRTYTTTGNARVVTVTDDGDRFQQIVKALGDGAHLWSNATAKANSSSMGSQFPYHPVFPGQFQQPNWIPNKAFEVYLTTDETAAIQHLLQQRE